MAKFYGSVGYADTVETAPGVHEEKIVEYPYYGDLTRNVRQLQSGETLNDDINIANEISIVADPFARKNFHKMRFFVGYLQTLIANKKKLKTFHVMCFLGLFPINCRWKISDK